MWLFLDRDFFGLELGYLVRVGIMVGVVRMSSFTEEGVGSIE